MNDAIYQQVGRNCLRDFTGISNPENMCAMAEVLFSVSDLFTAAEDDDFEGGFDGMRSFTSVESYLPFVTCSIRRDGWLSRTTAREQCRDGESTADQAMTFGVFARPESKDRLIPEEKDYNLAAATIEFCNDYFDGCDIAALSDYENSLRVAMASGIVHPKFIGIIASAVKFYQKDLEKRARNEVWSKMVASSEFQGTVGERQVFENLKVVGYRTWESQYGTTHFYSFISEAGHFFTYFASRDMDLSVGQVVSLNASVKKHEVYSPKSGAPAYKQTTITRAKLVTRANVKSSEVVEKVEQKCTNKGGYQENGTYAGAEYVDVRVKYNHYHFESNDGRKFLLVSKSKKKALVAGVEALVEYATEDYSKLNGGERPVSLVKG